MKEYHNNFPSREGEENNIQQNENITEEENFFKDFTNQEIDIRDPSLEEDLTKIYEEEVPFEIRKENDELTENSSFEPLLCKILDSEGMSKNTRIIIEIECNQDLFFYYKTEINPGTFEKLKKSQRLTYDIKQFSDLLINFFDECINNSKKFFAVFTLQNDGKGKMELFENLGHKFADLITLVFEPVSGDIIRQQIIYRYNSMRALEDIAENKIRIINNVLKEFDPQLIYEVKKDKVESNLRNKLIIKKP